MSKQITDLTKIIVDNIYVPLLTESMSIYDLTMNNCEIGEKNSKLFYNIFRNDILIGTLFFWFNGKFSGNFNEISYKSETSYSYDNCDPNSGFIIQYVDGIDDDKINIKMLKQTFVRFFNRVSKYEEEVSEKSKNEKDCTENYFITEDYLVDEDQNYETTFEEINSNEPEVLPEPSALEKHNAVLKKYNEIKYKKYSKEEFIEILTKITNTVISRTINFVKKNMSKFDSGIVLNLCPYLEESEINDDMMFFDKLLKNYIFKKKLEEELEKFGLKYKIKSIKKILIHSRSVVVN